MSDYDTIFFKHFYENFDFEKCTAIFDNGRLVSIKYKIYTIDVNYKLRTSYIFFIKDKRLECWYGEPKLNKFAEKLILKTHSMQAFFKQKIEENRIAELNKFLESLHS